MTNTPAITKNTPIVFSINPESLVELKKEQDELLTKVPEDIEKLDVELYKKAKRKVAKLRIATEKERKELKSAALSYGKLVDSTAADAQKPVTEIENVYDKLITEYDGHFAELARVAAEKEEMRIFVIKDKIDYYAGIGIGPNFTSNELKSELEHLQSWSTDGFDFQEFTEEAKESFQVKESYIKAQLESRLKFEKDQAEQEAQRKIDEENRAKLEAEKAEFEAKQKEAQDKIDASLAAIQKEKDDLQRAENERLQKEQEERAQVELKKQQEELEKQRAIDEENRKKAEEAEKLRIDQIRIENEARKLAQEKEDRIRNAAPELLKTLEYGMQFFLSLDENEKDALRGRYKPCFDKIKKSIKLAKGE